MFCCYFAIGVVLLCVCFFFFKQKTAYEMRISDWSSDMCSSDLFLLAALFTDALIARLTSIGRLGRLLQLAAGATMILMGIAMITGQLSTFSYWVLDTFQALAGIG